MRKQSITLDLEVPDGHDLTGEFWQADDGEDYLNNCSEAIRRVGNATSVRYPILRKAWRPPSWLPAGVWVYWTGARWNASRIGPVEISADVYNLPYSTDIHDFAFIDDLNNLHEEKFVPPPVLKIQVRK